MQNKTWEELYYERKLALTGDAQKLYEFLAEQDEGDALFEVIEMALNVAHGKIRPEVLRYKLDEIVSTEAERYADENEAA